MNIFLMGLRLLITSQFYIAILATSLFSFFQLSLDLPVTGSQAISIFLLFWTGYRYTKNRDKKTTTQKVLSVILCLATCSLMVYEHSSNFYLLILLGLMGLSYNSNLLSIQLRNHGVWKIFHVATCWAIVMAGFFKQHWDNAAALITFTYIAALIIPFDIRDIDEDSMQTIPKQLGVKRSKWLALLLLLPSLIISYINLPLSSTIALAISVLYAAFMTLLAHAKRPFWYYSFFTEAAVCLPFILFYFIN